MSSKFFTNQGTNTLENRYYFNRDICMSAMIVDKKIIMFQALPQRIKTYWMPCENYTPNFKDCQVG